MKATLAALCGLIACSSLAALTARAAEPDSPIVGTYIESDPGQVFYNGGGRGATPVPFGVLATLNRSFGEAPGYDADYTNAFAFLPWHLDPGYSLFFASIGGSVTDQGDFVGNFGGGYRQYVSEWDRMYGISGWLDVDDGNRDTYSRAGISLETLGRYLDARLNGYTVVGDDSFSIFDDYVGNPYFQANQILLSRQRVLESAYSGIDGEIGGLLPLLGRYGVYGYLGGYYMDADEDESTVGYSARMQVQVTDDATFGARYTNDDLFGSNVWFNVAITLPNGIPETWFTPRTVQQRMASPVQREIRVPTHIASRMSTEALRNPLDGNEYFVNHVNPAAAGGNGTFENPFGTLEQARLANSPNVDIIRVLGNADGSGTNLAINGTFQLFDNQRLLSTSVDHLLPTTVGLFTLPGFTGGPNPLVSLTSAAPSSVIGMGNGSEISGFTVDGSARHMGITAANVNGWDINRNRIINGFNGINVAANNGGLTSGSIRQNTIGGNIQDGINANVTNNSTLNLNFIGNLFGQFAGAQNGRSHFVLNQDSGLAQLNFDGNLFGFTPNTAVDIQSTGTAQTQINAVNNVFGAAAAGDVLRTGFSSASLAANDDGSTGIVPIGFLANFFGLNFNNVFVNNNGNVTFNNALGTFTPFPILAQGLPIIAPFFADVDTRQGNVVTYGQGTVNGRPAFGVNYIDVRHFSATGGPNAGLPTNSFQLVLIDRSDISPGDFDIEFNYDRILWEAGQASGSNPQGLGGSTARVGFSNGSTNAFELPGSAVPGALLDSGPPATSLVQNSRNSGLLGRYIFQARSGQVLTATGGDALRINATGNAVIQPSNVSNNTFNSSGSNAINLQASNSALYQGMTIRNNTINTSGLSALNIEARDQTLIQNLLVQGNSITNSGGNSINLQASNDARYQGVTIQNNMMDTSTLTGLNIEARDQTLIQDLLVQGNSITNSAQNGVLLRSSGTASIVTPLFDGNTVSMNGIDGYHIEVLGSTAMSPIIRNGIISGNAANGISLLVTDTAAAAPTIFNNEISGSPTGISLQTLLQSNLTGLIQANSLSGFTNGIVLDRRDLAAVNNLVIGNAIGQTGLGNSITGGTATGISLLGRGSDNAVNRVRIAGNSISGNQNGLLTSLQADAIFVTDVSQNLFDSNALNGVLVTTINDSSFGDPRIVGGASVFDGNTFTSNGSAALRFNALDRSFHEVAITGVANRTTITGSGGAGIVINSAANAGLAPGVPSPIPTQNTYLVQGADIDLNNMGTGDGILVSATGGAGTNVIVGGAGVGQNVNILEAGDNGLMFSSVIGPNDLTVTNTFIGSSTNDGLNLTHGVVGGSFNVALNNVRSMSNGGRGLFAEVQNGGATFNVQSSVFNTNGREGIVLSTFDPIASTGDSRRVGQGSGNQTDTNNNMMGDTLNPNAPPFSNDPTIEVQNFVGLNDIFRDLTASTNFSTRFNLYDSEVRFNGNDGLVLSVGSNTRQNVDLQGNIFGGNGLADIRIFPVASVNPPSDSLNQAEPNTDFVRLDPTAFLDLRFGTDRVNVGDQIAVTTLGDASTASITRTGNFTNADVFKMTTRGVRGVFQVQANNDGTFTNPAPDTTPNDINENVFIQLGQRQNLEQAFFSAGFIIVPTQTFPEPGNVFQ